MTIHDARPQLARPELQGSRKWTLSGSSGWAHFDVRQFRFDAIAGRGGFSALPLDGPRTSLAGT
jgi:hypothetical protein